MNIASFILPKSEVSYLRDDMTLRNALMTLRASGYTAIPVIDKEDRYVGVASEGDFLWGIMGHVEYQEEMLKEHKIASHTVRDIIRSGKFAPACIDTNMEQLLEQAKRQNFVPVVDDRNVFIGIITRRDIITYFTKETHLAEEMREF